MFSLSLIVAEHGKWPSRKGEAASQSGSDKDAALGDYGADVRQCFSAAVATRTKLKQTSKPSCLAHPKKKILFNVQILSYKSSVLRSASTAAHHKLVCDIRGKETRLQSQRPATEGSNRWSGCSFHH